jgi:hypothetical protein
MLFSDLFVANAYRSVPKGEAVLAAEEKPVGHVSVFLTPASLASFPVAATAVIMVWELTKKLVPAVGASAWVPVLTSFVVGLVIFLTSITNPKIRPPKTGAQWVVAIIVALINSLFLAAAALGVVR